jgi:F0F1-type ATP synthase assembly protein I
MILFLNILVLMVNAFIQIANVYVLLACRLLSGIFVGAYLGIVPIYVH